MQFIPFLLSTVTRVLIRLLNV